MQTLLRLFGPDGTEVQPPDLQDPLLRAVIISLFTWRRAAADDVLPSADRHGWWGDSHPSIEGDRIGSRLWLLTREKITAETIARATEYANEALQWLLDDGVAESVTVEVERQGMTMLAMRVLIVRGDQSRVDIRFADVWDFRPVPVRMSTPQCIESIYDPVSPAVTYTFAELNPADKSVNMTLSGGNLTAVRTAGASSWASVRSTVGKRAGKWYFEVTNNANGATDGDAMWGFMRDSDSLATYPGNAALGATSMGWEPNVTPNSARYQNGSLGPVAGYGRVAPGQYSGFAIDFDAGKLWVKNSSAAGWAGGGDPAAGSTPTFTFTPNTHLHVALAAFSNPQSATANFGATPFVGTVPAGFNQGWYAPIVPISPVFVSSHPLPSTTDVQGIATDGTHVWCSSSTTLYKYTKAGALVTSRNVSGDDPVNKSQINGLFATNCALFVSAAENSTPRKSYIVRYNKDTLEYISHAQITGDWFSEGLAYRHGVWWVCFHANKVVAKVNPITWSVEATYDLSFNITGSSGGYGAGTGYDGIAWIGDYLICNIHEIYDQDFIDIYYFDGSEFLEVGRITRPTALASQGIAVDPVETGVMWFAERNYVGNDSFAKTSI